MEKKDKYFDFTWIAEELEKLEDKLNKGSEKIQYDFTKTQAKAHNLLKDLEKELADAGNLGEEKVKDLKKSIDEMKDILQRDFEFDYLKFNNSSKKLSDLLKELEEKFKDWVDERGKVAKEKGGHFKDEFQKQLHRLRIDLLIHEIYFEYNKRKSAETFEQWKTDAVDKVSALKEDIETRIKGAGKKMNTFNDELQEAFQHINKAFKGLFK